MRTLVVYYSRTGTTRDVAGAIARAIGADVEEIVDSSSRGGILGFLWSGMESSLELEPAIRAGTHDPCDYDLVIVGSPVWASNVSTPVRAYLSGARGLLPAVALFCTMGGRGDERALRKMEELAGVRPVARMALRERTPWKEGQRAIQAFVEEASAAVAARPRPAAKRDGGKRGMVEGTAS